MKKLFLATLLLASVSLGATAQKIKGSDTVLPLSQKLAEEYMKKHKSGTITVTGGGSGVGISALLSGTTEIAQASRKIKFDEKQKLQESGKRAKEVIIAYDALAVVVHPSNKVEKLTREQMQEIFTGKVKNWKEVGGEDMKIIPYSRETSSGTYEFFKESVLKNKNYMNGIMSLPATGAIVQSISQTKGGIGYIGVAYLSKEVKALQVSYDKGKTFTAPSIKSAKDKSYPIVRPLYYYYEAQQENKVSDFIRYTLSPEGQKIVREIGFISIK
ncbi:PstS family phosphate ABC transporter substrate-binding protein [Porphyromonas sp.]|uniref:PstS family phosphate ABC transporter substrate-binding protein n=1 Tax=Porphyromonas sp. TaxID=1924944 RepID=UPI0026DC9E6A|nr:PstS family phosphate ABC transporter substrate-binding protein [Porphyromonas sp.]MDO4695267.1 PstS family phosphate ABC transporter substrate-binding protein [Porphyromonas sp.]MDO4770695.1 PstS family phosphate ABC transporter substrate-binding protein [Porphyromonas sp.]